MRLVDQDPMIWYGIACVLLRRLGTKQIITTDDSAACLGLNSPELTQLDDATLELEQMVPRETHAV